MNAMVKHGEAPPATGGGGFALVPRTMQEAMDLAKMMASAGFLARELQTPGGAMFVIEQAMRWNMSPFAVAMETSFIQGKPMFSGKIVAAACTSTGSVAGRLHYAYSGEGDDRAITVTGTRRGEAEALSVTVRLRDARTANRHWVSQPEQQLAYHGSRVWARRYTPEVMLGVNSPEEFDDAPAPMPPARGPVLDAAPAAPRPAYVAVTADGEAEDHATPEAWRAACLDAIAAAHDAAELARWWAANVEHARAAARNGGREAAVAVKAAVDARGAMLAAGDAAEPEGDDAGAIADARQGEFA